MEGAINDERTEGLLKPCTEVTEKNNVLIACSLGRSIRGKLPVCVMNVSPEPQCLREGTKLGGFSIWEEGCDAAVIACLNVNKQPQPSAHYPKWEIEQLIQALNLDAEQLDNTQLRTVREMLSKYAGVFSTRDIDLGRTKLVQHRIDTGNTRPTSTETGPCPSASRD